MKLLLAALALTALAGPVEARAGAVARPAPALDRLVRLLLPEPMMVEMAMRAAARELDREPGGAAQHARHPGLRAHVASRVQPRMTRVLRGALPALRDEVGAILAAELNETEIAEAARFVAGPVGQKLYVHALRALADRPGMPPEQAMASAMASLEIGEYPAVLAFGATSASRKLARLNPRIAAAGRAWSNRIAAEHGEELRALARVAIEAYLSRLERGRS